MNEAPEFLTGENSKRSERSGTSEAREYGRMLSLLLRSSLPLPPEALFDSRLSLKPSFLED